MQNENHGAPKILHNDNKYDINALHNLTKISRIAIDYTKFSVNKMSEKFVKNSNHATLQGSIDCSSDAMERNYTYICILAYVYTCI